MIKFENVSKTYPNGVKGLKNINLEIEQGEFVSIIGLSGAGKSFLLYFYGIYEEISLLMKIHLYHPPLKFLL